MFFFSNDIILNMYHSSMHICSTAKRLFIGFTTDQQRHWFLRMGQSRVALPERESCTPDPEGSTKCRHFLSVNARTWPTDTARSRRRSNWAPSRGGSSPRLSQSTQIPSRFFDNYTRLFVRLSNLRIDRILAGLSSRRLALSDSRLAVARQTLSRLTAKLYSLGHAALN